MYGFLLKRSALKACAVTDEGEGTGDVGAELLGAPAASWSSVVECAPWQAESKAILASAQVVRKRTFTAPMMIEAVSESLQSRYD